MFREGISASSAFPTPTCSFSVNFNEPFWFLSAVDSPRGSSNLYSSDCSSRIGCRLFCIQHGSHRSPRYPSSRRPCSRIFLRSQNSASTSTRLLHFLFVSDCPSQSPIFPEFFKQNNIRLCLLQPLLLQLNFSGQPLNRRSQILADSHQPRNRTTTQLKPPPIGALGSCLGGMKPMVRSREMLKPAPPKAKTEPPKKEFKTATQKHLFPKNQHPFNSLRQTFWGRLHAQKVQPKLSQLSQPKK